MSCACSWGWLPDGSHCPDHFCGQPSDEDVDRWIMAEDTSPHPRTEWMIQQARAASGIARSKARVSGSVVELVQPIMGDVWYTDTHLTGRVGREVVDWNVLALVEVSPRGETFVAS